LPVNLTEGALQTQNSTAPVADGVAPNVVVHTDLLAKEASSGKGDADQAKPDAVGGWLFAHELFCHACVHRCANQVRAVPPPIGGDFTCV
jgi:hypothetical protein